jgi:hypothetical protein
MELRKNSGQEYLPTVLYGEKKISFDMEQSIEAKFALKCV